MWKLLFLLLASSSLLVSGAEDQLEQPLNGDLVAEASNIYGQQATYQHQSPQGYASSGPSYSAPAPAPSYSAPAPAYSAPAPGPSYSAPAPAYAATPGYTQPGYDQATQSSASYGSYSATSQHYGSAPAYNSYNMTGKYDVYSSYSPWRSTPGGYTKESYGGARYENKKHRYNAHSVYASYLSSGPYEAYAKQCSRSYGQAPKISYEHLNHAFTDAIYKINQYNQYEHMQYKSGNYLNASTYSSQARHQVGSYKAQQHMPIHIKEKEALFMEMASRYLMKHHCLSKLDAHYLLPQVKVGPKTGNPYGDNSCYAAYNGGSAQHQLQCRDSRYRTMDGSCNNLYHPYWGKAFVCHLRLVPAAYEDGIHKPRMTSHVGVPLPSARVISSRAHADQPDRSYYTHLKMTWGQYINHDITFTPTSQANYEGGLIKCCPNSHHPQCLAIDIPANDYQSQYKKTCMNFVRSAPCPLCSLGPRQQMNIATSYLDNGAIYGSSKSDMHRLRLHSHGLLRSQRDKCGGEILPPTKTPWDDSCSSQYPGMLCFDSGDPRVNQHPTLQMMHTLMARAHNHHARGLARVNPKWGDERLFQEARRLSVAQMQHITYNEYLPILFGPTLMKYYDLEAYSGGYTRYEPYTDPTSWNDYATAACRFGHSQIANFFSLVGYGGPAKNGSQPGFWLKDWFFDPKLMYDCQIDAMVKGMTHDHAMVVDPWIGGDVHNYLYRARKEHVGSDLPAFNIQRSRDHGIPPYHVYLKFCFGFEATSWDDLGKFIPYEQLHIFKGIYKDWRDLEFWPAGVSEHKFPDADVGPTFACVLGIQYYHIKFGDRYFYSHGHQTGSFKPDQLANIKHVSTLSAFLCHNTDRLGSIQKHAFFPAGGYNSHVPCKSMPHINYNLWKEAY